MDMPLEGFIEYQRRECCKDAKCPVQLELDKQKDETEYEKTRQTCSQSCKYTTWQFHHWLIEKGYVILAHSKLKHNEQTILANIDKGLVDWVDEQVKAGKCKHRGRLVANAIAQYKKNQEEAHAAQKP